MSWNARIEQRSTSAPLFPCTPVGRLRGGCKGQEDDNGHEISCADSAAQLILAKSEVWGDERRGKLQFLQWYPFTDHRQILALKPKGQNGPAKERQTFLLCYSYWRAINDNGTDEAKLIDQLSMMGMKYHKDRTTFRGHDAYRILIADSDVDIDVVLSLLPSSGFERGEEFNSVLTGTQKDDAAIS